MTAHVSAVVACDTEPIAVAGLRSLLGGGNEFRLVAGETSLADGTEAVRIFSPDVLVVDKAFGIHPVMEWLREIRAGVQKTQVVVWASNLNETESLRFLQAGAAGVIRKASPLGTLLQCLRTAVRGGSWMEAELYGGSLRRPDRSPLTARELQVMELVERGLKNKDIGVALGIRTGTVKIHLKHIFEKTGVRGRYGLALTGLQEKGLLAMPAPEAM
jgi:DNA-binding NarL/FixJ family response regulator